MGVRVASDYSKNINASRAAAQEYFKLKDRRLRCCLHYSRLVAVIFAVFAIGVVCQIGPAGIIVVAQIK